MEAASETDLKEDIADVRRRRIGTIEDGTDLWGAGLLNRLDLV